MSQPASVQDLVDDSRPPSFRQAPIRVLLSDIVLVSARVIPKFYNIFLPLTPKRAYSDITIAGLTFQIVVTFYSLLLYVPLLLLGLLVGGIAPILAATLAAWPFLLLQSPTLVRVSQRESAVRDSYRRLHKREAWFFINGIATSRSGVVLILRRLETLFQRPITGILNRSLGPVVDLIECIIQRDLSYATESVRQGYQEIRKSLVDTNVDKVILICHSQGGIITSLIVDQLLADLPNDQLSKLEIYTFANAANHFSNPELLFSKGQRAIPHIEHYANGKDPVSQIGVLAYSASTAAPRGTTSSTQSLRSRASGSGEKAIPVVTGNLNKFHGRLFARWNISGHLLLSHYLGLNSILGTPDAVQHSRLRRYIGGTSPED